MTDSAALPVRALRRHVRVGCKVNAAGNAHQAVTKNISTSGLYIYVVDNAEARASLQPGEIVLVSLELPASDSTLKVRSRIVWTNPDDRDAEDQPAIGIGVHFVEADPKTHEALRRFVEAFRYTVVLVDDDRQTLGVLFPALGESYNVVPCLSGEHALQYLREHEAAALVVGQRLPDMTGLALLRTLKSLFPHGHTAKIVLSDTANADDIQSLVNEGRIYHYAKKPIEPNALIQIVAGGISTYVLATENDRLNEELERANKRLERENSYLRQRVAGMQSFHGLVGTSSSFREALAQLDRVLQTDTTIHVRGETGTGKELVARALHNGGPRAGGPFVAQNCAGISETLLQSTLFGHKRGSFTGADREHRGVFQRAHMGTLFLDEVAELSLPIQGSLLRVLQDGDVTPLGSEQSVKVNVRVVSATHKDLREEVQQGRFREDLYFRLVVLQVHLPPLRERTGDVELLASHFLDLHAQRYGKDIRSIGLEAMQALQAYAWPGNIRELENEVERGVVLAEGGRKLLSEHLSPHVVGALRAQDSKASTESPQSSGVPMSLELETVAQAGIDPYLQAIEASILRDALEKCQGNQSRVASVLKLPRQTLRHRLKRHGLCSA